MSNIEILTVVGARPQFIKAAALTRVIREFSGVNEKIIHTGQHYDRKMSEIFFEDLEIGKPDYFLDINRCSHGAMTGRMLEKIEDIILKDKPDAMVVYGDTNSTLAGALAASKQGVPVIHIESGLRSFNRSMPEEINRIMTDHLSDQLFCPTQDAVKNLSNEGIINQVHLVGDIMFDATKYAISTKIANVALPEQIKDSSNFCVVTIHREENLRSAERLKSILEFIEKTSQELNLKPIFPAHPNAVKQIEKLNLDASFMEIISPLGYFELQKLLSESRLVLTDSGGLQKEAYFHQVPCITLRDETEWVETIAAGWNQLWNSPVLFEGIKQDIPEYGNGDSASIICNKIYDFIKASR